MIASEAISPPFTLTFFGPMQVLVEGRPLAPLHSRKSLWLLALLALRQGRPVEREWLAGTLWPDIDQSAASTNLRVALSVLRRALGGERGRLQSPGRHTLSLNLEGADVDVRAFDQAVISSKTADLERAVALYGGPLLEGCAEDWAEPERADREQRCLEALQTLADAALAAEDWEASARYSRRAISLDPWRESARRGLMRALAEGGDGNAALDAYKTFVRLLRKDDPKAAPDEETTALYARLRTKARQRASVPVVAPSLIISKGAVASTLSGSLPHSLTDLIGREDERQELAEMLGRSRLVTLTGPGGIGKTRLAIAVAEEAVSEFANGARLVALETISDGSQIGPQIASVLGLKDEAGRTSLESLISHLRPKRLLLVLDNCEHLLDASAQLTGGLLRECPGLCILATSREALGVTGETVWVTPALSTPDPAYLPTIPSALVRVLSGYESVRLFVERARSVQNAFVLTRDNARAVAQICARMEGIPLAIELAAARVRSLTVQQISARLDDRLALLTGGSRAAHSRQQTLRATLDWSYDLLKPSEQRLLACVSIFTGGWNLEAAEALFSDEDVPSREMLDLLTSLVDKSLVVFDAAGGMESGRYRLLEIVRQYASLRLVESDRERLMQVRHRDWFLKIAEAANLQSVEADELDRAVQRLEMDYDNLRSALAWCERDDRGAQFGLRMAAALSRFWSTRHFYREGRAILQRALSREGVQKTTLEYGLAFKGAGILAALQTDYVAARAYHEQGLIILREVGDRKGTGHALDQLNDVAHYQGDTAAAQAYYEEARAHFEQSLRIARERGDKRRIAEELRALGMLINNQNRGSVVRPQVDEVRGIFEESLNIYRELGDKSRSAMQLNSLGVMSHTQGDHETARRYYEQSLLLYREMEAKSGIAMQLNSLGILAYDRGDYVSAQSYYEECLAIFSELDDKWWIARSFRCLFLVSLKQEDYALAQAFEEREILLRREIGDQGGLASGLEGIATVALSLSDTRRAVRLWGAAQSLRESSGAYLFLAVAKENYERRVSQARSMMSEEEFGAAWEEGRALTIEQALEYALGEDLSN